MNKFAITAFAMVLLAQAGAQAASRPSVGMLLKRAQYEQVVVSPDGSKLAIAFHTGGDTRVSVLDRATMKPVAQVNPGSRGEVGELDWMGNQKLLISANRRLSGYNAAIVNPLLYLVNLHEKHPKILTAFFLGTIDGDTRHIVVQSCGNFSEKNCVRRIDTENKEDPVLLANAPKHTDSFVLDHAGHVRFAFGVDKTSRSRLYLRQGKGKWKLINDSHETHLHIVPLGVSRDDKSGYIQAGQPTGPDAIERYDFATGKRVTMLRDPVSDPLRLIYSLDGKVIIGAWYGPGRPHARYFHPESNDAKWHRALSNSFPQSLVVIDSASADGNVLVVHTQSDRDPGSFYLLDRASHKLQHLFSVAPWIDPSRMATNMPFTMKARDGQVLHGFVSMPPGGKRPAPMVVVVHGGPFGVRDGWLYDPETQLLALHGYAVLHVNFRGSAGEGQKFEVSGYRQWGRAMQDDVTDATRWAIDKGLADPRRVCIYGASYGGYAALMGAALEPKLYRCAIGLAGVYDLNKLYTWGDAHRSDYGLNYLKRVLGQDKQALARYSPVNLVDRITMPVLLAHGTLDDRVPIQYAHVMRRAMRRAGHPVEYKEYGWEGHGLARADDQRDFYDRLLDFLHANIGGKAAADTH